ncbi:MAG TPA: hypothetical protein VN698_03410 [Bacteroidia bacterium]|nr:hypothetical protein [Bacteroidia bacterium]
MNNKTGKAPLKFNGVEIGEANFCIDDKGAVKFNANTHKSKADVIEELFEKALERAKNMSKEEIEAIQKEMQERGITEIK